MWTTGVVRVPAAEPDFSKWTNLRCIRHLAKARWGSCERVICPHCGTYDVHCWAPGELRWKCKGCGSRFSVTSKTVFADRKLPLQTLVAAMHVWAEAGGGDVAAAELARRMKFAGFPTAKNLLQRLRHHAEAHKRGLGSAGAPIGQA